jgi:cytochrome c oxidase subunit 2
MLVVASAGMLLLGACSVQDRAQIRRLAMPVPASDRAEFTYHLWQWAWLAAILVGILVWGLIGYSIVKFRRRSETEVPVQTRYNLPIEILYTIAPIVMVLVFFFFTVETENEVLAPASASGRADHTIDVVGQQWSWTFNYVKEDAVGGKSVYTAGTTAVEPTLYLPINESIHVNLSSPDVIHSFWVPAFLFKMDVVPGRHNHFSFTPTRIGTYDGRCAELCGAYHSRMLFNVKIVRPATYAAYLHALQAKGNTGLAIGGSNDRTHAGLKALENSSENGAGS